MWKHSLYSTLIAILLAASASAATYTETFSDYSHNDPALTSADWNVFSQSLSLYRTESALTPKLVQTVSYPSGGFIALYEALSGGMYSLYLQRYDGNARPEWPEMKRVATSTDYIAGSAIAVSGMDIALAWAVGNPGNRIYAHRFDSSGSEQWAMPVVVNQNMSLENKGACDIAAGPLESVVIVWEDSRLGDQRIFAQKLDVDGNRSWSSADVPGQPGGAPQERTPKVAVDTAGRSFVVWEGNSDILMTRIDSSGAPSWINGVAVPVETLNEQRSPLIALLEGFGLFISYKENVYPLESVEIMYRDFNGNALWLSDRVVWSMDERIDNSAIAITPSGVLVGMGSPFEGNWAPYTRLIDFMGNFPASQPEAVDFSSVDWMALRAFQLVYSIGTGVMAVAQHGQELFLLKTVAMALTDDGGAVWDRAREFVNMPGDTTAGNASFIKGSEDGGGFSVTWMDTRNGAFDTFSRSFSDPATRIGAHDEFLAETPYSQATAAQAPDGKRVVVWVDSDGWPTVPAIMRGQWFNPDWTPIGDSFRISDLAGYATYTFDIGIDSLGRAAVAWADLRDPDRGIYYQVVTSPGARVFPADIKISDTSLTTYDDIRLEVFADGPAGVLWVDDHVSGYHVYYTRVLSDGSVAFPNVRVDPDDGVSKRNPDLMVYGSLAYVTYSTSVAGSNSIYAQSINYSLPSSPVLMGGPVETCYGTRVAFLPPLSLVAAWSGRVGTEFGIWAQRITGGVFDWSEPRVNALTSGNAVTIRDLICPADDSTVILFDHISADNIPVPYYQALDGSGARVFPSDNPLIDPRPYYSDSGSGVSAKLNGADAVRWAVITDADVTLNGGAVSWAVSPDGGFNWYGVTPGMPLSFASPGSDLRWRARLTADPAQQGSPVIRSVTVSWGSGTAYLTPDLDLNGVMFHAGDTFNLDLRLISSGGISADVFILLDVYGSYWFWPSWTQTLDYGMRTPPAGLTEENVFNFVWPTVDGSASGLRFWVGALASGTATLLGDIDMVEFGYE